MKARQNELSPVINRDLYELIPPGVDENLWREFRNKYNHASRLIFNDTPAELDIELNSDCILRCSFCIQSVRDMGKHRLGFENFKKLINEAISLNIRSLKLNYMNEPLILPDLEEYIIYAKEAGMINIFFSTNGILLTKKRSISLIESGLTKILISIDAINSETYLKQRNSDFYNKVVENTIQFIEIRNKMNLRFPLVRVNFLKNKINKYEEKDFVRFWSPIADMIIIQEMNELIDHESGIYLKIEKENYKCSFPFKHLVIDALGRIMPCCCMNGINLQLGHIDYMTLKEAWNCDKMRDLRNLHKYGGYNKSEVCRRCIDGI